jgi:hypothetical protein
MSKMQISEQDIQDAYLALDAAGQARIRAFVLQPERDHELPFNYAAWIDDMDQLCLFSKPDHEKTTSDWINIAREERLNAILNIGFGFGDTTDDGT